MGNVGSGRYLTRIEGSNQDKLLSVLKTCFIRQKQLKTMHNSFQNLKYLHLPAVGGLSYMTNHLIHDTSFVASTLISTAVLIPMLMYERRIITRLQKQHDVYDYFVVRTIYELNTSDSDLRVEKLMRTFDVATSEDECVSYYPGNVSLEKVEDEFENFLDLTLSSQQNSEIEHFRRHI